MDQLIFWGESMNPSDMEEGEQEEEEEGKADYSSLKP